MRKIDKKEQRKIRHKRIRAKVKGTSKIPRLSVFRSNKHLYAVLIDDDLGVTLAASSDVRLMGKEKKTMKELAALIGGDLAKQARAKKIQKAVFDRGGFKYTGNIEVLAQGAREGGLAF